MVALVTLRAYSREVGLESVTLAKYGEHINRLLETAVSVGVPPAHVYATLDLLHRLDTIAKTLESYNPNYLPYIDKIVKHLLDEFHRYTISYFHGMGNPFYYSHILARLRACIRPLEIYASRFLRHVPIQRTPQQAHHQQQVMHRSRMFIPLVTPPSPESKPEAKSGEKHK